MRLAFVALLVVATACARPPKRSKSDCDRGDETSAPMLLSLVRDRTHTASFRARRLQDLEKRYPDSPEARAALWFALASPKDVGDKPMPRALVQAANAVVSRGAPEQWLDLAVASLTRTANDVEDTLPEEAKRARQLAARLEDRAGRVFTLAEYRPGAGEIADDTDAGLTEGTRDLDEVLDAYLQCRRAPRDAWVRTRDRLKDPSTFQTDTRAKAAAAEVLKQTLGKFVAATVPEGEKP